jgi:hypothetical protein
MATMAPDCMSLPKAATRKSPRRQDSKLKITNEIHHQLFLGPTRARQARKRKIKEAEEKTLQSLARSAQNLKKDICKPTNEDALIKTSPQSPVRRKISPASPVTPESVHSKHASLKRKAKSVLPCERKKQKQIHKYEEGTKKTKKKFQRARDSHRTSSSSGHQTNHDSAGPASRATSRSAVPHSVQWNNPPERESPQTAPGQRAVSDEGLGDSRSSNQLWAQAVVQRRMNVIRRKTLAIEALTTATDVPSIFSSLWAFCQLHDGVKTDPVALNLASDAQTTGNLMLTHWLTEKFTSPRCFGGLAFSDVQSHILINRILNAFGASFGALDITTERLAAIGIPASVSAEILPHLSVIVGEIRARIHSLFDYIMYTTADPPLPAHA